MKRYEGEALGPNPKIAILANDAIGNFVIGTPLMRLLRNANPGSTIHYFGGKRTAELADASSLIDQAFQFYGGTALDAFEMAAAASKEHQYDFVFNMEFAPLAQSAASVLADHGFVSGQAVGPGGRGSLPFPADARGDLWRDLDWMAPNITAKYPFLQSGFIAEIFCRLAYLEGDIPGYELPSADPQIMVPEILFGASASQDDKLWPAEKWIEISRRLERAGFSSGLLGAPQKAQASLWVGADAEDRLVGETHTQDLRGKLTLPQVVGALAHAKAVFTLDNGILHFAAASDRPIVGLYRVGIHRLWAPPVPGLKIVLPPEGGQVASISADCAWLPLAEALGL